MPFPYLSKTRPPRRPKGPPPSKAAKTLVLLSYVFLALVFVLLALLFTWMCLANSREQKDREIAQLHQKLQETLDKIPKTYGDVINGQPNEIRGQVILRVGENQARQGVPGVKINLYPREVIDAALAARAGDKSGKDSAPFSFPEPLASTVSDAKGFYSIKAPKPGRYVVYGMAPIPTDAPRIWLLGVDTKEKQNTPMDLTELNRVHTTDKNLMVDEGR